MSKPRPRSGRFAESATIFHMLVEDHDLIRKIAYKKGVGVSHILREMIHEYCEEHKQEIGE